MARGGTPNRRRVRSVGDTLKYEQETYFSLSLSLFNGVLRSQSERESRSPGYFQARPFVSSCTQGSRCPQGESQTFRSNLTERKQFLANRLTTEEGVHDSNFST